MVVRNVGWCDVTMVRCGVVSRAIGNDLAHLKRLQETAHRNRQAQGKGVWLPLEEERKRSRRSFGEGLRGAQQQ